MDVTTYTIPQPTQHKTSLREKLSRLFSSLAFARNNATNAGAPTSRRGLKSLFSKKKIGTYAFVLIILAGLVLGLRTVFSIARRPVVNGVSTAPSEDVKTVAVNREFSIPVFGKDKKLSNPVRYIVTDAQLTKQIIIKGQRANAVKGRTFLILNLKLVNDFNDSLFLNTRNYVRVQAAGAEDKLAPEIHNDTVEVQPLSTKLTRIGLPVNETDRNFTVYVGEIEGEKQEISLSF